MSVFDTRKKAEIESCFTEKEQPYLKTRVEYVDNGWCVELFDRESDTYVGAL